MCKTEEKKASYVTPELMSELSDILEEESEEKALFDDFTKDLSETAPVTFTTKGAVNLPTDRESYLKERRHNPNVALPNSVES